MRTAAPARTLVAPTHAGRTTQAISLTAPPPQACEALAQLGDAIALIDRRACKLRWTSPAWLKLLPEMSAGTALEALEQTTKQKIPRQSSQWWSWWQDYNEYNWPKPTQYLCGYGQNYYPIYRFRFMTPNGGHSCFIAGTIVRAQTGLMPIETLQAGDRVLARDQDSGELSYKVVVRTTIRPASKLVRIEAGGDEITTTLGHPFWVDGHGWKMAKELTAGDRLHSLGGAVRIDKVEPAGEDKAYNLVVDDFNTYFVGQAGLLVHDNEFRKPTQAIVPGLVEEPVAQEKR